MRRVIVLVLVMCGTAFFAKAQKPDTVARQSKTDSMYRKIDSATSKPFVPRVKKEKVYHPDSTHSPHKAVMHSLMIPGWGQLYNHQWWKVPLIYGGIASLTYYIITSQQQYEDYLAVVIYKRDGIPYTDKKYANDPRRDLYAALDRYSEQAIIDAKDNAHRNRDVSILGLLAVWGVNVIDAYIDAKFKHSFSMDNNFGFKISPGTIGQPVYASNFNTTFIPTLKVTLTF